MSSFAVLSFSQWDCWMRSIKLQKPSPWSEMMGRGQLSAVYNQQQTYFVSSPQLVFFWWLFVLILSGHVRLRGSIFSDFFCDKWAAKNTLEWEKSLFPPSLNPIKIAPLTATSKGQMVMTSACAVCITTYLSSHAHEMSYSLYLVLVVRLLSLSSLEIEAWKETCVTGLVYGNKLLEHFKYQHRPHEYCSFMVHEYSTGYSSLAGDTDPLMLMLQIGSCEVK